MIRNFKGCLAAGLLVGALGVGTALADGPTQPTASQPSQQELMEKIQQLQQQVQDLQVAQQANGKDVDQIVQQVADDASRRSQLMDMSGATAGWNAAKNQFYIGSEDGNFYFHPGIIFQFRNATNYAEDGKKSGSNTTQTGFEVRRAKFYFDGNVFTPDLTYKFQWQDGNNGGTPSLEYGWAQYIFTHNVAGFDWGIKAGQFKDVVFKEETQIGDQMQLMVERSLANSLIGGNQAPGNLTQGADLVLTGKGPIHGEFSLHDGFGSGLTDFTNGEDLAPAVVPSDWGVATRWDYKVNGDWADTTDLTGKNSGKHDLLDFGAGADYSEYSNLAAVRGTVDVQYMTAQQLSLFAAFYIDNYESRNLAPGASKDGTNMGGVIEGGYMVTPALQLVARYSLTKADKNYRSNNQDQYHEFGVGFNWFMGDGGAYGNHSKVTVDLNYLPNGCPGAGGLDYLADPGHDEICLRVQYQLWL